MHDTFRVLSGNRVVGEFTLRKLRDKREAIMVAEMSGYDGGAARMRADGLMGMKNLLLAVDRHNTPVGMATHKDMPYENVDVVEDRVSLAWEVFENHRHRGIGPALANAALARHFEQRDGEASVSVDLTDVVAVRHLEKLGFTKDEQDTLPVSLRGPVPVSYSMSQATFILRQRLALMETPRLERDERCALSGLPIVAGTRIAMAIARHPRRRAEDDIDWEPGLVPDEALVGHVFEGEYDGAGWVQDAAPGAGIAETEKAVSQTLVAEHAPRWLKPDYGSALGFLGHLLGNAEMGGPVPPVGAIMARKDVLDAFVPDRGRPSTYEEATDDFKAALRVLGVPMAPSVRGGRPGIEWDAVSRMRDIVGELAYEGPTASP